MATPIEAETSRLGSFVDDSAMTANTTWPGFSSDSPSSRSISSQCGGKIELTRTRLKLARWASRRDISKLVSFSLCRPTPLVRKALRSEEHTSELQSPCNLVCRLLLEKKKKKKKNAQLSRMSAQ